MRQKIIVLFIVLLLTGCWKNNENIRKSEVVKEINIVTLTRSGSTYTPLLTEINKKLIEDLNIKVNIIPMTFAGINDKYQALISAGSNIDMIWGSSFWNSISYASQGAFLDIEKLLKENTPDLYNFYNKDQWESIKINGHLYSIPCSGTNIRYSSYGFLYREDLRKKYKLPEIIDLDSIESYLLGIKTDMNETPLVENGDQLNIFHIFNNLYKVDTAFGKSPNSYGVGVKYDNNGVLYDIWKSEEFLETCKMIKKWSDQGFWDKNILTSNENITNVLLNGNSVASFHAHPDLAFTEIVYPSSITHPDWEWGYLNLGEISGILIKQSLLGMFYAIPKYARNPIEALKILEKLTLDKDYYRLISYGIEGIDYKSDYLDYYQNINRDYIKNGMGTFPENSDFELKNPGQLQANNYKKKLDNKIIYDDMTTRFIEDYSEYIDTRDELNNIYNTYVKPLMAGTAPGTVEENIINLNKLADSAGKPELLHKLQQQWDNYLETLQ